MHRRNAVATSRLANHPLTRAYLEAGVRLPEREFAAEVTGEERFLRPLAGLTRETVIAEVANGPADLPRNGTVGSFRDRWAYFPDYLSDLARYTVRVRSGSPAAELAEEATTALADDDFVAAVHEVAYRNMLLAASSTALHFRFLAVTLAAQDQNVSEAMSTVYADITRTWRDMFDEVLAARGLTLRAGVSTEDLATILTALNEGLAFRVSNDPACGVRDDTRRRGLLGQAALALFAGCVDTGDGTGVEDLAERIAGAGDREWTGTGAGTDAQRVARRR